MSFPTASTPPTVSPLREGHDFSFSSSQSSNTDNSTLCFESSFRLETPFPNEKAESEKHPKGKRKRTTAQDKTVLESAYNSNPKPDKAARLEIVKRVSLNEKEVQIWFQNRRQNDRRKSRPLSPQEIEALRYGNGMRVLSSDPMPAPMALPNAAELPQDLPADTTTAVELEKRPSSSEDASSRHLSQPLSPQVVEAQKPAGEGNLDVEAKNTPAGTPPLLERRESEGDSHPYSQASATSIGYLANRWNTEHSFSTPTVERSGDDSFRYEWDARPSTDSDIDNGNPRLNSFSSSTSSAADVSPFTLQPPLSSSSSQVRLSLSLDGKAELISAQPSPPRPAPQLPLDSETLPPVRSSRHLQRSRSALPGITLPPISTLTATLNAPFPPGFIRGRSRDVHAWESCCEADTRDELTRQAENESSGSAIAAISLMRSSSSSASLSNLIHNHHSHSQSQSHSGVLQPNSSKRNVLGTACGSSNKKPKFGRASSSIARLQSVPPVSHEHLFLAGSGEETALEMGEDTLEPEKKRRKKLGNFTILSPSGDSDKENWSPGSDGNPHRPHTLPQPEISGLSPTKPVATLQRNPRRVGRILGEQDAMAKRLFSSDPAGGRNHRANTAPTPGHRLHKGGDAAVAIFEDSENAAWDEEGAKPLKEGKGEGEEVERFMASAVSPSKRPDMDCVAGLLSLSQGNWR
ncbi:hypothetical protein HD806DRAFT_519260 [Xylariaceae sp. AK1471]|nr:hypothetical protein HD806DRAFT_519260 [Xylariaceae sp. AK1471]